jgi:hypothetical protein
MPSLNRRLLACGVLASLVYVATDVVAALAYPDYHSFDSGLISELMAKGAPTERLVDPLLLAYDVLMMAFAAGVWRSDGRRRARVTAGLLFAYGALGLLGPTVGEMNIRGSDGDPAADILHIALTLVLVLLIFASVSVGAALRGRVFRLYSFATLLVMVGFGVLISLTSAGLAKGEPTPWLGVTERVEIAAFLLWVAALAIAFLRDGASHAPGKRGTQPLRGSPPEGATVQRSARD